MGRLRRRRESPQAFLVGSANLTIAGLHDNVELMALADASDHAYLRSTLQELLHKSWDATDRLARNSSSTATRPQTATTPAADNPATPPQATDTPPPRLAAVGHRSWPRRPW